MSDEKQRVIQLEISLEKLETLFSHGELCANDIRCLNPGAQRDIWALCLSACAKRLIYPVEQHHQSI